MIIRNCEICGVEFKTLPSIIAKGKGKLCSRECANKYMAVNKINNKGIIKNCKTCGKEMYVVPSYDRIFCSRKCSSVSAPYEITNEIRQKMRESHLGKPSHKRNGKWYECPTCGKKTYAPPSNIKSKTGRRFCSQTCSGKGLPDRFVKSRGCTRGRRKENPKTDESKIVRKRIEYIEWRNDVFKRDDWNCQKCNKKGGKLHPHHILNFASHPEVRFDVSNGITFCILHHKEFHRLYGKVRNNESQIIDFLKNSIND